MDVRGHRVPMEYRSEEFVQLQSRIELACTTTLQRELCTVKIRYMRGLNDSGSNQ